ncbi:phytanoyl-CoA dioxygenase, peroxisomal-like [Acropora millepora]|uniref:phytanoyl-CoA dioxygenase, peroxisomal-like n=1 Tax=Acropora millepora TaxID=45264 RepID=UPI001CF18F16|nr:phytanoyl-CoA dioxygenase, peroxisomal-like [Acropora millepora]
MADRSCSRLSVISSHLNCCKSQLKTSCVRATSSFNCNDRLVVPNDFLTEEQVHFYNKNGYLVVRNLVPADMLNRFVERFHEICSGDILVPGMTVMKDLKHVKWNSPMSERTVNKLQNFEEDEVLFSYCELPQILKYVTCFTGPDAKSVHTMLINKPPDPGTKTSRHPLHQDLHYFPFRPANRIVCSWTAMEKVDKQNGCLVVLPGSHYSPLLQHHYPKWEGGVNAMYHGIKDCDSDIPLLHLEMNAGDTVFFHPLLIHGSGANTTNRFRKAISGHFASSHCYYIDVKGTSQENIEAEVLEIVHKVVGEGIDLSFQEIWKIKSRLVHGSEGGDH